MSFRTATPKTLLTSCLATGLLAGGAHADLTGLVVESFVGEGWVANGFSGFTTWRVYATFDGDPLDGVISVMGLGSSPIAAKSSDTEFFNAPVFDTMCSPLDLGPVGILQNQWDTHIARNRMFREDKDCDIDPKPWGGLAGDFSCTDCGVFLTPDDERVAPIDNRFFIMQFTVEEGETIGGQLNLLLLDGQQIIGATFAAPGHCSADLNGDGDIGFDDLLEVLSNWGCGVCPDQDIDESGIVDFGDILEVFSQWGACGAG